MMFCACECLCMVYPFESGEVTSQKVRKSFAHSHYIKQAHPSLAILGLFHILDHVLREN